MKLGLYPYDEAIGKYNMNVRAVPPYELYYASSTSRDHSVLDLTGPDGYPFQNSPYGDPFRSLPENCGDSMAGCRKPVTGHARRGEEQTGWDVSVKTSRVQSFSFTGL